MSFSATTRRVVRSLAHRNIDWSSPIFKGDPELAASANQFRAWAANAEAMAEKYSAPPAPIDFAAAKKTVRDVDLVASLENLYKTSRPPPEVYEWSAEDKADKARQIKEAEGRIAFTQEMIEETEKEIAYMKANRTTRETSASDLKEIYPDLAEEIEKEIENREWFKDTLSK